MILGDGDSMNNNDYNVVVDICIDVAIFG